MNQQEKALDLIKDASKLKVKIMITITLNKIKEHNPCVDGWKILLKSKPGLDYNEPFPLSDILDSNGLHDALWVLRCLPQYGNIWRKYAVWCARQVQHLMTDQRSIDALDVAWRHSICEATDGELDAAAGAAWDAWAVAGAVAGAAAGATAGAAARDAAGDAAWDAAGDAAWAAAWDAARAAQSQKLRQILDAGEWVE